MSQITTILDSIFKTNGGTTRQWRSANELLLTHTDEIKKYVAYMKNKIRDLNKNTQLLALDFLDYSIDDGKIPLWTQVGSKEFLSSLVNIYKTRNDNEVQTKILYLIQKWANKFHKYNTIIPNFNSTYENLKNNDVEFPEDIESTYEKYLQGGNNVNNNSENNFNNNTFNNNNTNNKNNNKEINSQNKNYVKRINVDLRTNSYERKYKRLVNKLDDWTQQIQDANIFMDNANEEGFDDDLRGIMNDLETGKNQLVDTIESGKLKDEKLMQISLNVKDDIDMTIKRWNDVKNGRKPSQFKSSFFSGNDNNYKNFGNDSGNNMNNQNNNAGFDLLGFDDLGGNNMNNNTGNNNLGNDLLDVFSGNNNNSNTTNLNNPNIDFFGNMGNNNNSQNNNQNFFGNINNSGQNNQNNINNDFFTNSSQQNDQNNMNNNFFGNDNNFNQNNQNQNNANNDLFSQIFNNNTNNNNININNLQNDLNTVYNETNQFGINFNNNNMNNINDKNNNQINSNNNNNFNNIMAFDGSDFSKNNNNFNFNDNNNQNNKNKGNQDFDFNF